MLETKDTILVLRFTRLEYIPSAKNSAQLLAESGLPVLVIEYGSLRETKKRVQDSFQRVRMDAPWVRFLPKKFQLVMILAWVFLRLSVSFVLKGRPKFILAHGASEQFLAWLFFLFARVPYVIHAHEVFEKADIQGSLSLFLLSLEKLIYRSASFTIFSQKKRAEVYVEKYKIKTPIFLAANTPRFQPVPAQYDIRKAHHLPADSIVMGYVGGVGSNNLFESAIMALASLPKVFFLVWGFGDKPYIEKLNSLAHVCGVSDRFLYLGPVSEEEKLQKLCSCDLSYCIYDPKTLRLKYLAEASNKLFEAMAAGIPSVFSSNPDFYQFNKLHPVGVCARSLTVDGIAQAVALLAHDLTLRKNLGANARRIFEAEFHYEHQFFKPLQAYQDLYFGYPEIWSLNQTYLPPEPDPEVA